jgi:hypothetical protein
MAKIRSLIPAKLLVAAAVVLILSPFARPLLETLATKEQVSQNVLLSAIPFVLFFVAIVLAYMALIVFAGKLLSNRVSEVIYRIIEYALIVGIALGVLGMFQPWLFVLFKIGFFVLLLSTLSFILWSHVVLKRTRR